MADLPEGATKHSPGQRKPPVSGRCDLGQPEISGGCRYCTGRTRIAVITPEGVAGFLVSAPEWWLDLPEDPAEHPKTPHWQVEWHATDSTGRRLQEISVDTLPNAAQRLYLRALAGGSPFAAAIS